MQPYGCPAHPNLSANSKNKNYFLITVKPMDCGVFSFAYQANFTAVIVSNACMAPPADLEPFSLFSHFRHHSDTHLTAPLARRSSAIAGAVQSHQATFLLIAGPQRDIFISLSDKYISLRGRNYEEKDNLAIYLGAICALQFQGLLCRWIYRTTSSGRKAFL